jgi:diphthamide synthase (EF-2-diphthine--ammonia ligase)
MSSISSQVRIIDDRSDKDRLPRGLAGVRRTLEDVNVQVVNSEAIFTAKMTERMENIAAGQSAQAVSFVSHMWTQRNGSWQLHDVQIVSASSLERALRR